MYTTSIAFTFFLSWATVFAAKEVKPKHSPLSAAPVDAGHLSRSDSFVRNPSFGRNRGEIEQNIKGNSLSDKHTHQSSSRNEEPLLYRFEQGYPPQSSLESYYSSNESDLSHLSTESSMQGSHESSYSLGSHHLPNESHQTDISSSPEEFARRNPTLSSLSDQSLSSSTSASSSLSDQSSMSSASSLSSHGAYHPMAHITPSHISTESSLSRDSISSELERRRGHHQQTRGYPVSPDRINQHQHKHQHGSIARRKRIRIQPASLIKLEVNINAQHSPNPIDKNGKKEEQKNEFIVMVFWRSDHHLVERFDTKFVR